MKEKLLENSFDFSIRLVELYKYLLSEGREFPISGRLLDCGNGVGVNLRLVGMSEGKEQSEAANQALACAVECEHLIMLLVKTGYLTSRQSMPLRTDCNNLIESIANMKRRLRRQKGDPAFDEIADKAGT